MITPHESDAEFFTPEDVDKDFASLNNTLREKRIEYIVRELLRKPDVYDALKQIVAGGSSATQIETLANAVLALEADVDKKSEDAAKEQSARQTI